MEEFVSHHRALLCYTFVEDNCVGRNPLPHQGNLFCVHHPRAIPLHVSEVTAGLDLDVECARAANHNTPGGIGDGGLRNANAWLGLLDVLGTQRCNENGEESGEREEAPPHEPSVAMRIGIGSVVGADEAHNIGV